jgi:hypothetical protein
VPIATVQGPKSSCRYYPTYSRSLSDQHRGESSAVGIEWKYGNQNASDTVGRREAALELAIDACAHHVPFSACIVSSTDSATPAYARRAVPRPSAIHTWIRALGKHEGVQSSSKGRRRISSSFAFSSQF